MTQILCTWRVSYHKDATTPAVETLRDVNKEAAMEELRKHIAEATAQRIVAEVVDERGGRIAKHTWLKTATGYVRSSKFD